MLDTTSLYDIIFSSPFRFRLEAAWKYYTYSLWTPLRTALFEVKLSYDLVCLSVGHLADRTVSLNFLKREGECYTTTLLPEQLFIISFVWAISISPTTPCTNYVLDWHMLYLCISSELCSARPGLWRWQRRCHRHGYDREVVIDNIHLL